MISIEGSGVASVLRRANSRSIGSSGRMSQWMDRMQVYQGRIGMTGQAVGGNGMLASKNIGRNEGDELGYLLVGEGVKRGIW